MAIDTDHATATVANGDTSHRTEADDIRDRDGHNIPKEDAFGYKIHEQPMGNRRPLSVILMGCGLSSLNFFKQAEADLTNVTIRCYEKNDDVGGTWYENRYPGCACDIPSVNYQFTWKPKLWTHYYSSSKEIWEYIKDIEQEGDFINKYVKLRHTIEGARWDDDAGLWRITVRDLRTGNVFEDQAEFFINAGGVLNSWKLPEIVGLDQFQGKVMHTANYEEGYDLKGKNVAVLGAGSSGVQAVSAVQKEVQHLYHWIRSPIWITAGFAGTWAGDDGANFAYTEEQKQYLTDNPDKYLEYRKRIESEINVRFKFIIKQSEEAAKAREFSYEQMRRKLKYDDRISSKIIPKNFNPGCRRPTPAPGYLEALVADNTTIFTDKIKEMTKDGFVDQGGTEHDLDVLICATGFDTSWQPRFPLVAHGRDLREAWKPENGGVTSYLAIGVPEYPNHFTYCGPYGPLGHGSFMHLIEKWTKYIFRCISKTQVENIKSITPKAEAARQFRQHADLFLQRTSWTSPCPSWFKQGKTDGQAAIWPGSRVQYLELMSEVRWEDYDVKWKEENRFAFLGNGFHMREFDGRDTTDYVGNLDPDGRDVQPIWDEDLVDKLAGWKLPETNGV